MSLFKKGGLADNLIHNASNITNTALNNPMLQNLVKKGAAAVGQAFGVPPQATESLIDMGLTTVPKQSTITLQRVSATSPQVIAHVDGKPNSELQKLIDTHVEILHNNGQISISTGDQTSWKKGTNEHFIPYVKRLFKNHPYAMAGILVLPVAGLIYGGCYLYKKMARKRR